LEEFSTFPPKPSKHPALLQLKQQGKKDKNIFHIRKLCLD